MSNVERRGVGLAAALCLGGLHAACGTTPSVESRQTTAPTSAPVAPATSSVLAPDTSAEAFTLDWPDGATATVTATRVVTRVVGTRASGGARGRVSFRIAIERDGADTVLRASELSLEADPAPIPEDSLQAVLVIGSFIPSARWRGNLAGLALVAPDDDGALVRAAVASALDESLTTLPAFAAMAPGVSGEPQNLLRQADAILGLITGLDGATVAPGDDLAFEDTAVSNVGIEIGLDGVLHLGELCACDEAAASAGTCRRVEMRSTYDVAPVEAALGGAARIRSMRSTHRLVVAPATLVPHRIEAEKLTTFVVHASDRELTVDETETSVWVFRWDLP